MEIDWQRIDIEAARAAGYGTDPEVRCEHVVERGEKDKWLIAAAPINDTNEEIEWSTSTGGTVMRIPLVPYRWPKDLDLALGISFMLGTRVPVALDGETIKKVVLVTGKPVEDFYDADQANLLFHLGLAVQLKSTHKPNMEVVH